MDDAEGTLDYINFGGVHILSHAKMVFFPFNSWQVKRVELLSQDGTVPVSLHVSDTKDRDSATMETELKAILFSFPYLANEQVELKTFDENYTVKFKLSSDEFKESIYEQLSEAGFKITTNS